MNVLVTGGAGYIGSHAVRALLAHGDTPVVMDNLFRGHRQAVPENVPFFQADLAETDKIVGILTDYKIEAVLHFAALTYVGESVQQPLRYYANNTAGAISLLSAMDRAGVRKMVFSSTAATFGEPEEVPIVETSPQRPINPYGRSKWMVEQILRDYADANPKFGYCILRYFNVAGDSLSGDIGEDHTPETHIIPNILFVPLGKKESFTLFGNDYPTPDGTCVRDYVHVEDLIDAHILALDALKDGDRRYYNLGIGRGYSVQEMLDAAERVVGRKIPHQVGPRRSGDPGTLYTSSEKIQRELGWSPKHTEVDDVIATAWNWHKSHPNGYGS
ncbi:MAG: UDP-glucose 4-epimerase GalE [Thermoguttaceae bacterium]|nr:UDP-glucose 4-epimerase GalE [Thermoguttaceae bacterium]